MNQNKLKNAEDMKEDFEFDFDVNEFKTNEK